MSLSPHILLQDYLPPDLVAQLARDGDLPATVRATLAADLRRTIAAFAAYIPSRLVRAQLADPTPGRVSGAFWQGSLLFADLSGFTALSEHLSVLGKQGAEEVSAIINRLFDTLVAEVRTQRGGLLKFGGDALTAFFDADVLGSVHAAAATLAALAMQARMQEFASLETRAGVFKLGLRVGVHSGRVFAAEVGDASHIELVVTGAEVNRVALAQEIAAPGQVVISDQTAALLEGATFRPLVTETGVDAGFQHIVSLPDVALPPTPLDPATANGADDIATLVRLGAQVAALQPYLVRNLPRRFLDTSATELGEFRPVTVLFANFHDFSALLDRLGDDAATAAAVLNAYYRRAQAVVHHYDGIVNKVDMYTHGDKLMALFGAPTAHEDEPLRAVRCALELEHALAEANAEIATLLGPAMSGWSAERPNEDSPPPAPRSPLHQRIGINTGTVFAGRVGGARRYEYTVMGPAVNLAARLMAAADDGAVLLSPATRAAVERFIAVEEQAPLRLKGLTNPIVPARALHVREVERAFDAVDETSLRQAQLVGREAELAVLIAAGRAALGGGGRVLAIVGEAGIGKTRLSEELIQRLVMESVAPGSAGVPAFVIYSGECQSYEQRTPYAALRTPLRHLLGFKPSHRRLVTAGTGEAFVPLLQTRVEQLAPRLVRFTPLLGDILGVTLPETPLTQALTGEQRRDRLQELVVELLLGAAMRDPLLFTLDDLQWADASSLELLDRLTRAISDAPLLLLLNYRPDPPIPEPWRDLPATTRLELRELSYDSSVALLEGMLGGPPPAGVLPLLDRTQGNPFFIEELVRALVNAGALARASDNQWWLTRPLDQVAVPNSIEGLLIARLDRLDEPRYELVQVASVVGRRFQYPIVEGVYSNPAPLEDGLQRLVAIEIIIAEQQARELAYLFRHALLRDVAYEGILYARRRELHRRVARRIEDLSSDHLNEHLALLAWHYLQAEEWEATFRFHIAAGVQAQQRFANRDALVLFKTALDIAPRLAPRQEAVRLIGHVVELHERIGDIHTLLGEYDASEAAYREALALLAAGDATAASHRVRLHRLLAIVEERRSDYDRAFDWLVHGIAQATSETQDELARCYLLGAGMYRRQGEHARSLEWTRIALNLAERTGNLRDQAHTLKMLGGTYLALGDNIRALEFTSRALQLYEQVQDLTGLADAHNDLAITYQMLGRLNEARSQFEAGAAIKEAIGDIYGQAMIANNLGELLRLQDQIDEAIEQYQRSLAIFERLGSLYATGVLHMNLGATYLLRGDTGNATTHLQRSADLFGQAGTEEFLPELERYYAELHLERGELAEARQHCTLALDVAARLEARIEEGITRRTLGHLLARQGDLAGAWAQFEHSLAILRAADSSLESVRTLLAMADLAPALGRLSEGQRALHEALPTLGEIGARRDLAIAHEVALRHGYTI